MTFSLDEKNESKLNQINEIKDIIKTQIDLLI